MAEPMGPPDGQRRDQVWSFRGYRLSSGEFNTAMVHYYRAEVTRCNVWRTRLDATTNWAVVATGATLSFAFSDPSHTHIMIPLNTLLVTLFLYIEARRYRYYELWAYRARLMETDFFGAMLAPPFQPGETWAGQLVESLLYPTFPITFWEAFGRRFRHNYQFIFLLLAVAWMVKIVLHPGLDTPGVSPLEVAALGSIPGEVVLGLGLLFNISIFAIGWLTAGLRESKGEVLTKMDLNLGPLQNAADALGHGIHLPGRRQELAYIITSQASAERIADRVMTTMARGVTAVPGKGMYTGEDRMVLFVAIQPNQISTLKQLVYETDPKAFLIFHHADEVVGRGFRAPS